jgi:hypothetical protein
MNPATLSNSLEHGKATIRAAHDPGLEGRAGEDAH